MKHKTLLLCTLLLGSGTTAFAEASPASPAPFICKADAVVKHNNRPAEADRLFRSDAVEKEILRICKLLTNQRCITLRVMTAHPTHLSIRATFLLCGSATQGPRFSLTCSWLIRIKSSGRCWPVSSCVS